MQRIILAVALILFSALATVAHADNKELVIIFSGDNAGAIEPGGCGCSAKRGGLARRAAFIEKMRKENKNVLTVDCGDILSSGKTDTEIRAETISKAFGIIKYDAINVGETDFAFGTGFLKKMAAENKLPLVSSNLKISDDSKTIRPYIIRKFDGFKVGITGITDPSLFKNDTKDKDDIMKNDADKSLKTILSEMKGKADFVILLSHLGDEATSEFIDKNVPENVYIAVSGHGRGLFTEPRKIKKTFQVQNSLSGESVGILRIRLNGKSRPESCILENNSLPQSIPDHSEIAKIIKSMDSMIAKSESIQRAKELKEKNDKAEAERKRMLELTPEQFMEEMRKRDGIKMPSEK